MRWLRALLGGDPLQLPLGLVAPPADAEALLARLCALGLRGIERCRLTRNRTVMVSVRGAELRVHESYLGASDDVHRAIVRFVNGRGRAERLRARRVILEHPVSHACAAPRRRRPPVERLAPADRERVERLSRLHAELNARHFGGELRAIPIRLSSRMRRRLGQYTARAADAEPEIAIGRAHARRDDWAEVTGTLLHEMVHQWQEESGLPLDHGRAFRAKARELGIAPRASRLLDDAPRARLASAAAGSGR